MSAVGSIAALYAAVLVTVDLAWRVWSWRRDRGSGVTVSVVHGAVPAAEFTTDPAGSGTLYQLTVIVANGGLRSEHVERVDVRDLEGHAGVELSRGLALTEELPPGRTLRYSAVASTISFIWNQEPFVAVVELGSGERVVSAQERLDAELVRRTS